MAKRNTPTDSAASSDRRTFLYTLGAAVPLVPLLPDLPTDDILDSDDDSDSSDSDGDSSTPTPEETSTPTPEEETSTPTPEEETSTPTPEEETSSPTPEEETSTPTPEEESDSSTDDDSGSSSSDGDADSSSPDGQADQAGPGGEADPASQNGSASRTVNNGRFRTVTVAAGERETVDVSGRQTLQNVLYDVTAEGSSIFFDVNGSGWTMRNVGVRGVNESDDPLMHASVSHPRGTGRLENVYFGDGTTDGDGVGIWVDATGSDAHRGTLVFDRVHVARFADNGIYASGPGYQLGADRGGEVHIRNSLARNNNISQFRVGTNGSSITNSLALVDGDVPSTNGIVNPRGIWLREEATDITVENTETVMRGGHGALAMVAHKLGGGSVSNSVIDGPTQGDDNLAFEDVLEVAKGTPSPPKGVPMSAEEAVRGR